MTKLRIEWDESKNASNIRKHGVSFDEASTVFSDPHALLRDDPDHSADEDRFLLMGFNASLRVLVVCHCYRRRDHIIRIFSARKATKSEHAAYTRRWKT